MVTFYNIVYKLYGFFLINKRFVRVRNLGPPTLEVSNQLSQTFFMHESPRRTFFRGDPDVTRNFELLLTPNLIKTVRNVLFVSTLYISILLYRSCGFNFASFTIILRFRQ